MLFTILFFLSTAFASQHPPAMDTDGIDKVLQWTYAQNSFAEKDYVSKVGRRWPSPERWSREVVYQIMVDRFNDGDPSNNFLNIENFQKQNQNGTQYRIDDYRHGGDLRGIIQRLDYLADLGVTSLWITPILKSQGSYHGYCLQDPTRVDPGFGTAEDLRELVSEAHKRGLKIILDIVVNHICDPGTGYDDQQTPLEPKFYEMCVNDLSSKQYLGYPQNPRGQRQLNFGPDFFAPLRSPYFYSRCGYNPGDSSSSGAAAVFGDFSPLMIDFDTTNWDFQKVFTDLHKYWIAYADVDGYRLDAAKHVTQDFMAYFSTETRAYAQSLGKKNFFIIGEVADSPSMMATYLGKMKANIDNPASSGGLPPALRDRLIQLKNTYKSLYIAFPGLNAIYDFAHSGAMVDVFKYAAAPMRLKNWFWSGDETENTSCGGEFCDLTSNGDTHVNWNLIEIHDWPRFLLNISNSARIYPALGYLMTTQGVPILYYGIEQGFSGSCDGVRSSVRDPSAQAHIGEICSTANFAIHTRYRQDMFMSGPWRLGSIIPAVNQLAYIGAANGSPSGANDPYLNRNHDLYRFTRQLTHLRTSCEALGDGAIYFRAVHKSPGLIAYSRIRHGQEIVVLVNSADREIHIPEVVIDAAINTGRLGQTYRNVFNMSEAATVVHDRDGSTRLKLGPRFSVKPQSVAMFIYERELRDASTCR